ncbi:hypothetical protein Dda_1913 [Drechslerella dactyloides]|uniref:Uncharacterized protein n=1 Tax=Drechslerella dactyloides TaxID=74499 RepID=A0AAD6NMK0_DREDA|nr:hypothetical protein Dda_1913 [Drechslerella dactyloides]
MTSSVQARATFNSLPTEIHRRIFFYIESFYEEKGLVRKAGPDPFPHEMKQLAYISQLWRDIIMDRKFRCRQYVRRITQVRQLARLADNQIFPDYLRSFEFLALEYKELPELWILLSQICERGARLDALRISEYTCGDDQETVSRSWKLNPSWFTFFDFSDAVREATARIHTGRLELDMSVGRKQDAVRQMAPEFLHLLLSKLKGTTELELKIEGPSSSKQFQRKIHQVDLLPVSLSALTTLHLSYSPLNWQNQYAVGIGTLDNDEHDIEDKNQLANTLRYLSKQLHTIVLDYGQVSPCLFDPKVSELLPGEPADWPSLRRFQFRFVDKDTFIYQRNALGKIEPDDSFSSRGDDEIRYFFYIAARAVANQMPLIELFSMDICTGYGPSFQMSYGMYLGGKHKRYLSISRSLRPYGYGSWHGLNEDVVEDNPIAQMFRRGVYSRELDMEAEYHGRAFGDFMYW